MAFVAYPPSLENKTWQKAKSALAGKTGIGEKLESLKKAHDAIEAGTFEPSNGLASKREVDEWKHAVDPQLAKALSFQKSLMEFSAFATEKSNDLKKKKTCPSKTRETVEKMSALAKKTALDVSECVRTVHDQLEEAEEKLAEIDLEGQLKACKSSPRNFVFALGPQVGVLVTKLGIGGRHRELVKQLAGGSGRLTEGQVTVEGSTYVFMIDTQPPGGLAIKIKKAVVQQLGREAKVKVRGGGVDLDGDSDLGAKQSAPKGDESGEGSSSRPTVSNQETLKKLSIHHGAMDSAGANKLLLNAPPGSWLLRFSTNQNQTVVTLKGFGEVRHLFSNVDGKDLSLQELVSRYQLDTRLNVRPGATFAPPTQTFPQQPPPQKSPPQRSPQQPPPKSTPSPESGSKTDTTGLSEIQQALHRLAINHGPMNSAGAEKALEGTPPGTWLLRFSTSQNVSVVSVHAGDGQFKHFLTNETGLDRTLQEMVQRCRLDPGKVLKPGGKSVGGDSAPQFDSSEEGARQSQISSHAKNLGSMGRAQAEAELLEAPKGTWVVRYDPGLKQNVVSIKATVGSFEHHPTAGITMDQITEKYTSVRMQGPSSGGVRTPTPLEKLRRAAGRAVQLHRGEKGIEGATPMADLYHAELIDAKNRYGRAIAPFFDVWRTCDTEDSFNEWMEKLDRGGDVSGKDRLKRAGLIGDNGKPKPMSTVKYLGDEERKEHEMQGGKLPKALVGSDPEHTEVVFVVGTDDKIFAGAYNRGTFNHSSLLAGAPVLSAGEMKFNSKGELTDITDKSGHYEPNPAMVLKGLAALKKQGVDLSKVRLTMNAHPLSPAPWLVYNADEFLTSGGSCPPRQTVQKK